MLEATRKNFTITITKIQEGLTRELNNIPDIDWSERARIGRLIKASDSGGYAIMNTNKGLIAVRFSSLLNLGIDFGDPTAVDLQGEIEKNPKKREDNGKRRAEDHAIVD